MDKPRSDAQEFLESHNTGCEAAAQLRLESYFDLRDRPDDRIIDMVKAGIPVRKIVWQLKSEGMDATQAWAKVYRIKEAWDSTTFSDYEEYSEWRESQE